MKDVMTVMLARPVIVVVIGCSKSCAAPEHGSFGDSRKQDKDHGAFSTDTPDR
jgi:hypothetical protein